MRIRAPLPEYRLEVIEGYMRPVFDGMESELNELMWELLLPFTVGSAALLEKIKRVERGELVEWGFESPYARITCTPETLTIEDKRKSGRGGNPLRIDLPLKEASLLLGRWLFECVWTEQQRRAITASGRART
jgi:hypothetical protein